MGDDGYAIGSDKFEISNIEQLRGKIIFTLSNDVGNEDGPYIEYQYQIEPLTEEKPAIISFFVIPEYDYHQQPADEYRVKLFHIEARDDGSGKNFFLEDAVVKDKMGNSGVKFYERIEKEDAIQDVILMMELVENSEHDGGSRKKRRKVSRNRKKIKTRRRKKKIKTRRRRKKIKTRRRRKKRRRKTRKKNI
tara:strand:- start:8691 stop:9266 length:576 start_codon:yes stop_codon:yes gene_type:complete